MTEGLPKTIGRYEIQHEIGRGTMGVVYRARDPALERTIALKVIELAFAINPDERAVFEKRFFAEAQIAARLSHPGIIVVHDVGRDASSGMLYIALEYLEGRTLAESLAPRAPLEWRPALLIVRKVALALYHAHAQRVVHRDIKPANIMVLPSGEPKIMDFGIARIETARLKLTQGGASFATPLYMSPEQALGHPVDARTDLFSLGALAYEMLTGRHAFGAENLPKIIGRVIRDEPVAATRIVPDLPPQIDDVIARALAKYPADRYPDGRTLAEDIGDVLAGRAPRHRGSSMEASATAFASKRPAVVYEPEDLDLDHAADLSVLLPSQPPEISASADARPAHAKTEGTAVRRPEVRLHPETAGRGLGLRLASGIALVALVVASSAYLFQRARTADTAPAQQATPPSAPSLPPDGHRPRAHDVDSPVLPAPPTPLPSGSAPSAQATPAPADAATPPARLAIDFEHSLEAGHVRVWVDDDLVLDQKLDSRVSKKIAFIKKREGTLEYVVEVDPGRRVVKVQVSWDENVRTRWLAGSFKSGATRQLEVRLGGLLKKNLSLEWR